MQAYPVPSSDEVTPTSTSTPTSKEGGWVPVIDNMIVLHKELNTTEMDEAEKKWWEDQVWFEESISKEDFSFEYNEVRKDDQSFKICFLICILI